jgi:hypothetical protein
MRRKISERRPSCRGKQSRIEEAARGTTCALQAAGGASNSQNPRLYRRSLGCTIEYDMAELILVVHCTKPIEVTCTI